MSRIISPRNLYSKISEFLFLFIHMHEFLPFYLFIFFPGFADSLPHHHFSAPEDQLLPLFPLTQPLE
jgi:hypothetical protein